MTDTSQYSAHRPRRPELTGKFRRELLPYPSDYFRTHGHRPHGGGEWKRIDCPACKKTKAMLVKLDTGGFTCQRCGKKGSDVLAFHMMAKGLPFLVAANQLGALDKSQEWGGLYAKP